MEIAQSTEAVKYTDCISAEELDSSTECPVNDIKQSDGEAPAFKIWRMWRTPSLPSLPGPHWLRVIAPDRVLSIGQLVQFDI